MSVDGRRLVYTDGRSAAYMYGEIYLKEAYKFRAERRDPLIVDAGANIGLATTYFKKLYPASRVYS
ncbi:MAG TPA: hypothetical protein VK436_00645, partial [Methanocella sp.]|nr:hypothetical protein [Methanocella sp.]